MPGTMWFGTRGYMQNIPCPVVNMDSPKMGWSSDIRYKNGGARIRRSKAAAKAYSLSWNMANADAIRPVLDYADGVYGDGPIYFADPFAMEKNMLPQHWATPSQAFYDGPILNGALTRPTLIATPANTLGYPAETAVFTVSAATAAKRTVFVPIPPGYTAWVGAHGTAGTGGTVLVAPATGPSTQGTAVALTLLPVTSTTRVNYSVSSGSAIGIVLYLGGSGTINLSGLMVQLFPTGQTPPTGGFISGQGHSGCSFTDQPDYTPYNAALNTVGVSISLLETESWRDTPNSTLL